MIGKTISHYRILEKLGEGGMGVVYKAEDTKLKRTIALKFLSPQVLGTDEEKARFVHEAQAAAALNHPNICTIYEIDEKDGQSFIAMECVEGESLKNKLKTGLLKFDEAIDIIMQAAAGLQKAHEKGIIHRDIKAANIMVTNEGQAKIMDFGLAKSAGMMKVTRTGTTVGTLAYMSPEQAHGEEVDHRSDIWSLGVVLYELLTGKTPFKGDHEAAIIYSILNEDAAPPSHITPEVPTEFDSIFAKMLQKNPDHRYASAGEVLSDLRKLQSGLEVKVALPMSRKAKRVVWGISAAVVIATVLIVGFKILIKRQPTAMAAENKLAVMYFENMADPEDMGRLGEIVTNLLITDLSESHYFQVVSSQRLYDILKLLGYEGVKVINRDLASQIAGKANAKWMVLGNILKTEPQIMLTAQLVDVGSGNAIASQKVSGEVGEDIFPLVDKLTVEIKKDLSLPAKAMKEPDRPVADVTTNSPEAYRYYLEGNEYAAKYYISDAIRSFKKAAELDSTFAMAHLMLAGYAETPEEKKQLLAKAVAYSDKVSQKEKHYIRCKEAWESKNHNEYIQELLKIVVRYPDEKEAFYKLGCYYGGWPRKYEKAIGYYNKAIEIDPLYKSAYNKLAYAYNALGDFEKSIWAINKYIAISPNEANPYDTRGDIYGENGKIDLAIASYKKALEIKPDFNMSIPKLGHMYLFKKEYAKAEDYYNKLFASPEKNWRSWGRYHLAHIPLYQGKFERALEVLNNGIAADRMEQVRGWTVASKHYLKAMIYEEKNHLDLALKEIKKYMEVVLKEDPFSNDYVYYGQDHYAYLLIKSGDIKKGEEILDTLKDDIEKKEPFFKWQEYGYYWYTAGKIAWAKGNLEESITSFNKAKKVNPYFENLDVNFILSVIYLELGRLGEAVSELERGLLKYNHRRADSSCIVGKAYYLLGVAYERSGWNTKAIEQYEEFLDLWKDADPGIVEVEDAKHRLAKLKSEV